MYFKPLNPFTNGESEHSKKFFRISEDPFEGLGAKLGCKSTKIN
jgi:hypothetical protein